MSKPFCYIFLAFCVLQISLSARIPRGTTNNAIETNAKNSSSEEENCACKLPKSPADQTDDSSSSEELTEEDIRNITKQLTESEHLSPEKTKQFTEILNKFTKGKSVDENVEGFIQLLVFAVASRSNATELELKNLFVNPKDIAPLTITEPAENKV